MLFSRCLVFPFAASAFSVGQLHDKLLYTALKAQLTLPKSSIWISTELTAEDSLARTPCTVASRPFANLSVRDVAFSEAV